MRILSVALFGLALVSASCQNAAAKNPIVEIETSAGKIKVELDEEKTPSTVKNFLAYVDDKHYDNTVFHRVIDGFMIQGGGFNPGMQNVKNEEEFSKLEKKTKDPIKLEVNKGLSNTRGTIAMARTGDPNSATAQFYINVADNSKSLDPNARSQGYAVFGKVIEGMDVVDKIKGAKTKVVIPMALEDIPVEDVVIKSVRRVEAK